MRAIIVGGGYAGMLTTQVLSDYFEEVILIEHYDDFLESKDRPTTIRKGIPQAYHLHVLLQRGQQIVNALVPHVMLKLKEHCLEVDWALDTKWYGPFGVYPQYPSGVKTLLFSRNYLDKLMIESIQQIKNVRVIIGEARQLLHHNHTIIGIHIKKNNSEWEEIRGDLIVDARGRRSTLTQTLKQSGYKIPTVTTIKNTLGYATRLYHLSAQHLKKFTQFYLQVYPGFTNKGVVLSPIENNYLLVTLIGTGLNQPPKDNNAFVAYLTSLENKELQNFLHYATPVTDAKVYRNMNNIHRHFGRMRKWPKGLIALGDAVCVFNPVYAQGMTVIAKEALLLKQKLEHLQKNPLLLSTNWEQLFQKEIDKQLFFPWLIVTAEDQRNCAPKCLSIYIKFMHWYFNRVLKTAVINSKIHTVFLQVLHMLKKPYALFRPKILLTILLRK